MLSYGHLWSAMFGATFEPGYACGTAAFFGTLKDSKQTIVSVTETSSITDSTVIC